MLTTEFDSFEKGMCLLVLEQKRSDSVSIGSVFASQFDTFLGTGIFNSDGAFLELLFYLIEYSANLGEMWK